MTGRTTTTRRFPAAPTSPGQARAFVVDSLQRAELDPDIAALVMSELATNAVLHAKTDFEVVLHIGDREATVEVRDGNPEPPTQRNPPQDATQGRGLSIIDALARSWGTAPAGDGKVVWAVVPTARNGPG